MERVLLSARLFDGAQTHLYRFKCRNAYGLQLVRSVQPSATIQAFDALCEVQSDKASVEITSPFDGIVKELLVKEGEVAKVGSGLCIIEVDEEAAETTDDAAPASPNLHQEQEAARVGESTPPSQVDQAHTKDAPSSSVRKSKPHPMDPNVQQTTSVGSAPTLGASHENVFAAPSVRHFARHQGVDLSKLVPGSGKGGRIMRQDVEDHLARPSASAQSSSFASSSESKADAAQDVVVELGRTRWGMWKAMVKVSSPVYVVYSFVLIKLCPAELGNSSLRVRYFSVSVDTVSLTFTVTAIPRVST